MFATRVQLCQQEHYFNGLPQPEDPRRVPQAHQNGPVARPGNGRETYHRPQHQLCESSPPTHSGAPHGRWQGTRLVEGSRSSRFRARLRHNCEKTEAGAASPSALMSVKRVPEV